MLNLDMTGTTYDYDSEGNLISAEDNADRNQTYLYSYDAGGNLTMCREAAYTTGSIAAYTGGSTYSYATGTETDGSPVWKDLLTSYNGNTITYDAIGNPLNWGSSLTDLTWSNGRRLVSLKNGTSVIQYGYDEPGLRTRKYANGTYTFFDRDASGNLVHETRNNETNHLYYYYDANGSIGSISHNGVRYAFLKNLQGDVIAILDTSGNVVARYIYDAWGRILSIIDGNGNANTSSTFIGNVNPIRYRGYYYDAETGWYYLNSRYYDPQVKRFISADGIIGANGAFIGMNLFAYCNNNPVKYADYTGALINISIFLKLGLTILGNLISGVNPQDAIILSVDSVIFGNEQPVTSEQLQEAGFKDTSEKSVAGLNTTLITNNIRQTNEISHFLAQCAYETNWGTWLTEIGSTEYFSNKPYGYKYRGAGYIQLTWDYNYKAFSEAMGDPEIYNQGADYVAENYAWQAAGWFWNNKNINSKIAEGATVKDITRMVNGGTATAGERQVYYNNTNV